MKKIMFNDKYGLTAAVLSGKKTMTRRFFFANIHEYNVIRQSLLDVEENQNENRRAIIKKYSRYQVGEIVAVAQSYESMANGGYLDRMTVPADINTLQSGRKVASFSMATTEKGKQQPSQKIWQRAVEDAGYKYVICRSFEDFMEQIGAYLR